MTSLEKTREILSWLDDLQTSTIEGTALSDVCPGDGIVHAIADLIDEE